MNVKTTFRKLLLLSIILFSVNMYSQTPISEYLYGQNAWMPELITGGEFEDVIDAINTDGDEPFKIIRIGGTTFDDSPPTWEQYENLIIKIRSIGAEPLVQIPISTSITYGANLLNWLNNTRGLNVKYFSIGNEPDLGWINEEVDGVTVDSAEDIAFYFKTRASAMKAVDSSIKIFGPDYSFFIDAVDRPDWNPMGTWHYPLLDNNDHGLWGTDENGNYYIDYYAFHVYQYVELDNVERKLKIVLDHIADINSNYRNSSNQLGWAITETHITTNNANVVEHDKTWSFYAGQHIAQIFGLGMKYKAFCVAPWSIHESSGLRDGNGSFEGGAFDLGFFDAGPNYNPRSTYYHEKMLSEKAKNNYLWGYTNNSNLTHVATQDDTGYAIMIMNDNSYGANFTVRLNYDTQVNTFLINLDAGISKQVQSFIGAYETQMLFLDTNGDLIGSIIYDTNNEAASEAPVYSGETPDRNASVSASLKINIGEIITNDAINIYPNPVSNGFINIENANGETIFIYNSNAQLILETESNKIDVRNLEKGLYFVRIGGVVKKIVINSLE